MYVRAYVYGIYVLGERFYIIKDSFVPLCVLVFV